MGRLGFGVGRRRARGRRLVQPAAPVPLISPSAGWTGAAASGFSSPPVDPVRTTAKPAMRLIVPPNQAFTDELLVGVTAWANDGGSLVTNCGLAKVTAHFEGSSVDIAAPSVQSFADANGELRAYFGWWVRLKRDGRNGTARLYFEATPRDATMQRRVIGPYTFLPRATLYDHDVEVAATPAEIPGQRYKTLAAAGAYLRSVAAVHPRIRVTEGGDLDPPLLTWPAYTTEGYLVIEATVPVRIRRTGYTTDINAVWQPGWARVCLRGGNIALDQQFVAHIYTQTAPPVDTWLDGCRLINSGGKYRLLRKATPVNASTVRGNGWFTEVAFSDAYVPLVNANLARGVTVTGCVGDLAQEALCVIGCTVTALESEAVTADLPAMTVSYGGAASSATIERSGATFTLRENGTSVATFTIAHTEAGYTANTNYTVQNVVNWINGRAGWSATLIDDTRAATYLTIAGAASVYNFAAQSAKTGPLTLYSPIGYHSDVYQQVTAKENVVFADNLITDAVAQNFFIGAGGLKDAMFLDNAIANRASTSTYGSDANLTSQYSGTQSHVVTAHNSFSRQNVTLNRVAGAYNPDAYSLLAANAFRRLSWDGAGAADADLVVRDNHLAAGAIAPAGSSGTTIGGSDADLFADAASGNFAPAGALAANLKSAVVSVDRKRKVRAAMAPAGACAL